MQETSNNEANNTSTETKNELATHVSKPKESIHSQSSKEFLYFNEKIKNEELFTLSSKSIEIVREKSQEVIHRNKEEETELEPFAKDCLHLYDGEWTVLKNNERFQKIKLEHVPKKDFSKIMAKTNPTFQTITKRSNYHPHSFSQSKTNIFVKCHSLHLEYGEVEPLFCSLELVNVATKQPVSERCYFSLNSYSLVNDFLDDYNVKKHLLKLSSEQPRMIFSVSEPSTEIYAILMIEKILQGSIDSIIKLYKSYSKDPSTLSKKINESCLGLKDYRQPFLWAFLPIFEDKDDQVKLVEGALAFKYLYPIDIETSKFDIYSLIASGTRDGLLKKHKAFPGHCVFEINTFDPQRFESNKTERALYIGDDKKIKHKSLEKTIEQIKQQQKEQAKEIAQTDEDFENERRMSVAGTSKQYLKYQVNEFLYSIPKAPFFTFVHQLYIYPMFADFTKVRIELDPKLKPRNMLLEVKYVRQQGALTSSLPVFSTIYSEELQKVYTSTVTMDKKDPQFLDEIKVILPLSIHPEHYLVFIFSHLHIEKVPAKRQKTLTTDNKVKKTIIGYSILSVEATINPQDQIHTLAILKSNPSHYSSIQESELAFDKKRNIFKCRTKLMSTLYPTDAEVSTFFKDCTPFLNAIDPSHEKNIKFVSNSVKKAMRATQTLQTIDFRKTISHLPLIMDMLFTLMCRAPDILNNFVDKDERKSIKGIEIGHKDTAPDDSSTDRTPSTGDDSALLKTLQEQFGDDSRMERRKSRNQENRRISIKATPQSLQASKRKSLVIGEKSAFLRVGNDSKSQRASFNPSDDLPKRSSKRFSLMAFKKDATPEKPEPKPIDFKDPNFDLRAYLLAQSSEKTTSKGDTVKRETSKFRRKSIAFLKGIFNTGKDESTVDQNTNNEDSKEIGFPIKTISMHGGEDTFADITDFLNISSNIWDLQKQALQALLALLKGAGMAQEKNDRSNTLLSSYVQYVFKDVIMTKSPVCYILCEMWTDILSKGEENPILSHQQKRKSPKQRRKTHSVDLNDPTTRNQMFEPLMYLDSLQFSWFFFDIILKSFLLLAPEDGGYKFSGLLKELIKVIAEKIRIFKDDYANKYLSQMVNVQLAFFFRDLFSGMNPSYVFDLMETYFNELQKDFTFMNVILKAEFLNIFSDHHHFLALNNSLYHPEEFIKESQCCPPIRLFANTIKEGFIFKDEPESLQQPINSLSYILTKHDWDARYQDPKSREFICRLYFPIIQLFVDHANQFDVLSKKYQSEYIKCFIWLLYGINRDFLADWFKKQSPTELSGFIRLLIYSLEAFKKADGDKDEAKQYAFESSVEAVKQIFSLFTKTVQDELFKNISKPHNINVQNIVKDSESHLFELCMQTLVTLIQSVNYPLSKELKEVILTYMEKLTPIFIHEGSNIYWKWIYGALLSCCNFQGENPEDVIELIKFIESPLESKICQPDESTPSEEDAQTEYEEETNEIKYATLDKLLEQLTDQTSGDMKFVKIFFLTYRSFVSPQELLAKLMAIFAKKTGRNADHLRVLNCIKHWITDHFYDFDNALVISLWRFLDQQVAKQTTYVQPAITLKKRLETNLLGIEDLYILTFSKSAPEPQIPKVYNPQFDILEWSPLEIARQMTIIEFEIFRNIQPKECFKLGWSKSNKHINSPNIVALSERFNTLSAWISTLIVKEKDIKRRAQLMTHFIKVAEQLRGLNNFNGVNAVISAFNNSGVHRLKKTKEHIKGKTLQIYDELCELVSTSSSYKNLREAIKCQPPCIPYIGMYLTDLTFIEEGNKDTKGNLINFFKRRKIAKVIMEMRIFQQTPYHLQKVPFLYNNLLLEGESIYDDKTIYNLSLEIEPRK